jgi:hypothetical protein
VERLAPPEQTDRGLSMAMTTIELRRELEELIAALERRVPHMERAGEAAIARDAEALRQEALRRLATLDDESRPASEGAPDADDSRG